MKVEAQFHRSHTIERFLKNLKGPKMKAAAAKGLTEHTEEQRRRSIVHMASYTGVPSSRYRSKTKVIKAKAGNPLQAEVRIDDYPIPLAEYGNPAWARDLNPGWKGGSVSSWPGVEATAWNRLQTFKGSFLAKGQVWIRKGPARDAPLRMLYMAVPANELAASWRPNVPKAERFAALDLEKRVVRHILRDLGV